MKQESTGKTAIALDLSVFFLTGDAVPYKISLIEYLIQRGGGTGPMKPGNRRIARLVLIPAAERFY